jgi:hypothetical protein
VAVRTGGRGRARAGAARQQLGVLRPRSVGVRPGVDHEAPVRRGTAGASAQAGGWGRPGARALGAQAVDSGRAADRGGGDKESA